MNILEIVKFGEAVDELVSGTYAMGKELSIRIEALGDSVRIHTRSHREYVKFEKLADTFEKFASVGAKLGVVFVLVTR